jgi:transcriptional regulator with XRE-family HTH domain
METQVAGEAFSENLQLLLAKLNVSRARLAQKIGIDKSVVSRWVSGSSVPSDHNMARLSQVIGELQAGFSGTDWALNNAAFRAKFGLPPRQDASALDDALRLRSFVASRRDIEREAAIYEGFYLTYNRSSTNNGYITRRAVKFWRDGRRFRFLSVGTSRLYDVEGEVFVLRGKLFCLGEMQRHEGVSLSVLNGTTRSTPDYLTGIASGAGADALSSPTATLMVMEFKGRFSGDGARDNKLWADLSAMAGELAPNDKAAKAIGRKITDLIDVRVTGAGTGGERDWLLRAPVTRIPGKRDR